MRSRTFKIEVQQIFGELLAYLQEFDELCTQIAHNEIVELNDLQHPATDKL